MLIMTTSLGKYVSPQRMDLFIPVVVHGFLTIMDAIIHGIYKTIIYPAVSFVKDLTDFPDRFQSKRRIVILTNTAADSP